MTTKPSMRHGSRPRHERLILSLRDVANRFSPPYVISLLCTTIIVICVGVTK